MEKIQDILRLKKENMNEKFLTGWVDKYNNKVINYLEFAKESISKLKHSSKLRKDQQ